jgi:4-hydroxy-tetrahydrodipicolinate synthase
MRAERMHEARQLFYHLLPMIRLLFDEPNPAPVKAALALQGMMRAELRAPMRPASTELTERLRYALAQLEEVEKHCDSE